MESFSEIVNRWPTASDLAKDLGLKPVTARSWRTRGIPPQRWLQVVSAAQRRGFTDISIEALARLHEIQAPAE